MAKTRGPWERPDDPQEEERAARSTDEIFRLMRGNGNQSRINDGRSN